MYNYQPQKKQKRKKSVCFRFTLFLLALAAIFFGAVYFLFFSEYLQVQGIDILGARAIKNSEILAVLDAALSGQKIYFAPASSIFLFSSSDEEQKLKEKFPRIEEIEIYKVLPDKLQVELKERKPAAVWCGSILLEHRKPTSTEAVLNEEMPGKSNLYYTYELDLDKCFYIDKTGIAFEQVSDIEMGLLDKNIIKFQEWRIDSILAGKDYFNVEFLEQAEKIKMQVEDKLDIVVDDFIAPNVLAKELYAISPQGWKIYFNIEGNIVEQVEILRTVLNKKISVKEQEQLEYIDLRAGEKVFYKFKN